MAHDGARVEDEFVAGAQDTNTHVHVLVVGAKALVVAADFTEDACAKDCAEAAQTLGHRPGDYDGKLAEILSELK